MVDEELEEYEDDWDDDLAFFDGTEEEGEMKKGELDLYKFMTTNGSGVASVVIDKGKYVSTLANQGCHGQVPYYIQDPDTKGLWSSLRYHDDEKRTKKMGNAWWRFITSSTGPYRLQEGMTIKRHKGTPYAVYVPLHKGMNGQLLMNFLIASRIPFENLPFLRSWYYFKQRFSNAEAMYIAAYVAMKDNGRVQWTGDLAHYPFSPNGIPIMSRRIINGDPLLNARTTIASGNHYPVNAIWTDGKDRGVVTSPHERPIVRLLSNDTPYKGVFTVYLKNKNMLKMPGIVNRLTITKILKEKGLP